MKRIISERECIVRRTNQGWVKSISIDYVRLNRLAPRRVLGLLVLVFGLVYNLTASALGVGAAEVDSYIGEPLSVRIPLFNVSEPNSLSIALESDQFDGDGQAKVSVKLDRSNSQLSILVRSDIVINEPYVGFTLDIVDDNSELSKDFVVLMDLPAKGAEQPAFSSVPVSSNVKARSQSVDSYQNASIMGPYETAVAGRIPEKFGAVLDGQSIWRVARRINEAMGVSKSQMIWALYQANPSAFSSKSITSLKAGVFLTIPPQSTVAAVSDAQAQDNLRALRLGEGGSVVANKPVNNPVEREANQADDDISEFGVLAETQSGTSDAAGDAPASNGDEGASEPFQVSGIDSAGQQNGVALDPQAQEIISSLTETVSSMSQQLDRKDKKIEFLENQVKELSSFIASENTARDSVVNPISSNTPKVQQELNALANEPLELAAPEISSSQEVAASSIPILKWGALGIVSISVLAYAFRRRLYDLGRSLNLFGANEHVELRTVIVEQSDPIDFDSIDDIDIETELAYKETAAAIHQKAHGFSDVADQFSERPIERDRDIRSVVQESLISSEALNTMPYLGMAEDSGEDEGALEFEIEKLESDLDEADVDDISFEERFETLLIEKDFDFARELLDFARYNEINDERYHCERLRLCEKMRDEDAFYEYYYEIESKISDFPQNLQTQISQLVVQLAHQ